MITLTHTCTHCGRDYTAAETREMARSTDGNWKVCPVDRYSAVQRLQSPRRYELTERDLTAMLAEQNAKCDRLESRRDSLLARGHEAHARAFDVQITKQRATIQRTKRALAKTRTN